MSEQETREATLAVRVPDHEPEHDRRLLEAVGGLVDQVVDRILLSPDRITTAAEGKRVMAGDDDTEALADTLQRIAVIATPIVRTVARGSRFLPRVPWVLVASTTASLVVTLTAGVREVRVIGSLIAQMRGYRSSRLDALLGDAPRTTPSAASSPPHDARKVA